jgi:hypothetical protein
MTIGTLSPTEKDLYKIVALVRQLAERNNAGVATADLNDNAITGAKLADNAVANAKLADMAQATFKMRAAGAGTGDPIDGTPAQAKTALAIAMADVSDYATGTWMPAITFSIPGNLGVAYTAQQGSYTKIGRLVVAPYRIITSSFTHTTASGTLLLTGLPFTAGGALAQWSTAVSIGGWTQAGYTQVLADILSGGTSARFLASGSGVPVVQVGVANMPSGGTPTLTGVAIYET